MEDLVPLFAMIFVFALIMIKLRIHNPEPHSWFAWYPVHLDSRGWTWLRWVERYQVGNAYEAEGYWAYRSKE
jgi:hypothetical protein